ncbi:putative oxidoreductase At4g09670 [Tasmannia lanceolata]|uniref:putative oxidoreductase At4g09670 n=1 Tax=Tasmannia lanceolata TaxID=3420 RepID=UPI0040632EB1
MVENQPIRFGVLGCAEITRKVARAISMAPNSTLYAIGSRSIDKAKKFAADNSFPSAIKIYGSYNEVLEDESVDVAYIPLPTSLHLKWAVMAAEKKKHVLLEKPATLNVGELDEILKACEANGVQYMDATMWMHHPRTEKMKEILSDRSLFGELRSIHTVYTSMGDKNFLENDIRVRPDLDALGALGDSGWYCIRMSLWAVDYELPKTVTAHRGPIFNKSGVNLSCGATLLWEDGKLATFHCSFVSNLTMDVSILGTNGTLRLNDFLIPFNETTASFSFSLRSRFLDRALGWEPTPKEHVVPTELPQEARMVMEIVRLAMKIRDSGSNPDKKWDSISRKTQLVVDAVKASMDKGFEPIEIVS